MIDSTIATIGRLTKKRAMVYFASPAAPAVAAAPGAGIGLVRTVMPSRSDWSPSATTCSPGLSPSSMTQSVSTRGPTLTLRNATLLSRADHRDAVQVLQFLHGALRNEQRAGLGVEEHARAPVLARPQHVVGVGEIQLHAERAGGAVDGALDRPDRARVRMRWCRRPASAGCRTPCASCPARVGSRLMMRR